MCPYVYLILFMFLDMITWIIMKWRGQYSARQNLKCWKKKMNDSIKLYTCIFFLWIFYDLYVDCFAHWSYSTCVCPEWLINKWSLVVNHTALFIINYICTTQIWKIIWVLEDINQNIVACVHIKLYMHVFVNSWLSRTIHDIVINKKKIISNWQSM